MVFAMWGLLGMCVISMFDVVLPKCNFERVMKDIAERFILASVCMQKAPATCAWIGIAACLFVCVCVCVWG